MPLGGLAVSGAIGLGSAIFKGVRGYNQKIEANRLAKNNVRPEMTRTAASIEQENQAREMAGTTRLPGQSYAENQIGSQSARDVNRIQQIGGSSGEMINGVTNVDANARSSTNDLAFQGAQLNQQNKKMYSDVLSGVNADQQNIFDYNKNQPFQTNQLRAQQLRGSSQQNINNGLDTLSDTAGMITTGMGYRKAGNYGMPATGSGQYGMPDYNNTYNRL